MKKKVSRRLLLIAIYIKVKYMIIRDPKMFLKNKIVKMETEANKKTSLRLTI